MFRVYSITLLSLAIIFPHVMGQTVGSTAALSNPANTVFNFADTPANTLLGGAYFSNGFSMGNGYATGTFNDFFPVSGPISLRSGQISLSLDFKTDSAASFISTGTIVGNSRAFYLPNASGTLSFPSATNPLMVNAVQIGNTTGNQSVDWAVTNTLLSVGGTVSGVNVNFRVFGFNGTTMTTDASLAIPHALNSVRWHPSLFYLAFAKSTGGGGNPEVAVYSYNTGVLNLTGSEELGGTSANAVAWRPEGNILAAGTSAAATGIRTYTFNQSTGVITLLSTAATSGVVQRSAMSWESNGNYVALGTVTSPQLQIFYFDGATITSTLNNAVGNTVSAVSCSSVSNFIAVGLTGGTDNLRVYQHTIASGTLTDLSASHVNETANVLSVHWSPDGTKLAVGLATGGTTQFRIYSFNQTTFVLTLESIANYTANVNAIRWSRDGFYIASADANTSAQPNLIAYSRVNTPFVLQNVNVVLNSDVAVTQPMLFQGYCEIQGNGYTLDISAITNFTIDSTSTLNLTNVRINGVSGANVNINDNSGTLILENCTWIQTGNYVFSKGNMQIQDLVTFQGSWNFAYQSVQTSTVASHSTLILDQGFTFSYDPVSNPVTNLLNFVDNTSTLFMRNSELHATLQGLTLTKGSLYVDRDSFFSSETQTDNAGNVTDNGITLGDGISADDFATTIGAGAQVQLKTGSLNYNNVNSSSWSMINSASMLNISAGTTLRLYKSLNLGSGFAQFGNNAVLGRAAGAQLIGGSSNQGRLIYLSL